MNFKNLSVLGISKRTQNVELPRHFSGFQEEFGELAHALGKFERGDPDIENLREEFADVLAWLTTLANITDIDLTEALHDKYVKDGGPEGNK